MTFAPFSIYVEIDPLYLILESHCPYVFQNLLLKIMTFIVRFVWLHWCMLEGTRTSALISVTLMTACNMYLNIVVRLRKKCLGIKLINLYNQFHCINQIGQAPVSKVAGLLMSAGVLLLVIVNYVIICKWSALPAGLYFLIANLGFILYCVMLQTVPLLVNCDAMCTDMIDSWKKCISKMKGFKMYWVKVVKAQRPVSVYYALTKFEQQTRRNYYSAVLDHTINALLLF